jgi:hypothetical protein
MKTIVGKVKIPALVAAWEEWRGTYHDRILKFELVYPEDVTPTAVDGSLPVDDDGEVVEHDFDEAIFTRIGEDGGIEPVEILGNDEILPGGTTYRVVAFLDRRDRGVTIMDRFIQKPFFDRRLRIEGPGPIDIAKIVPELEPIVPKVPPPLPRVLAARKRASDNGIGFFSPTITAPPNIGSVEVPGGLAVNQFTLPFRAAVGSVSIFVEVAAREVKLLVGLYDSSGRRVCRTSIRIDEMGIQTGSFDPTVLAAGDYFLAFNLDGYSSTPARFHSVSMNRDVTSMGAGTGIVEGSGAGLPELLAFDKMVRVNRFEPLLVRFAP